MFEVPPVACLFVLRCVPGSHILKERRSTPTCSQGCSAAGCPTLIRGIVVCTCRLLQFRETEFIHQVASSQRWAACSRAAVGVGVHIFRSSTLAHAERVSCTLCSGVCEQRSCPGIRHGRGAGPVGCARPNPCILLLPDRHCPGSRACDSSERRRHTFPDEIRNHVFQWVSCRSVYAFIRAQHMLHRRKFLRLAKILASSKLQFSSPATATCGITS